MSGILMHCVDHAAPTPASAPDGAPNTERAAATRQSGAQPAGVMRRRPLRARQWLGLGVVLAGAFIQMGHLIAALQAGLFAG